MCSNLELWGVGRGGVIRPTSQMFSSPLVEQVHVGNKEGKKQYRNLYWFLELPFILIPRRPYSIVKETADMSPKKEGEKEANREWSGRRVYNRGSYKTHFT
ncbi:UNVERIFIED_CONTAM: hypothetical protein K2H54_028664 [Gekko kuhli]